MAEHWRLKPEALGSIPSGTTFFLSLCRFKGLRTVTAQIISISLRTWVSPVYWAPNAVIKAQDSFVIILCSCCISQFTKTFGSKHTALYFNLCHAHTYVFCSEALLRFTLGSAEVWLVVYWGLLSCGGEPAYICGVLVVFMECLLCSLPPDCS